jgi:hypothetical protein
MIHNGEVEICRVSELNMGDMFMWQGTWFVVQKLENGRIYFYRRNDLNHKYEHKDKIVELGQKSQMFVQVSRSQPSNT